MCEHSLPSKACMARANHKQVVSKHGIEVKEVPPMVCIALIVCKVSDLKMVRTSCVSMGCMLVAL